MADSNPTFQEQRVGLAPVGLAVRKHGGQRDRLAPNIQSGSGAPSHTAPNGSLYLDDDVGDSYQRKAGVWVALATVASQENFRIVSSFPDTVASDDVVLLVTMTGTLALPTATAGRKLVFRARGGDLTLTHSSVETFSGGLDTSLSLFDGYGVTLRGDGTRWLIFPG